VRQLRTRQRNRPPFTVQDEYDVQDLLRSLLAIYFQDVRNEDPSPKQAAASSRIDFVLKTEHAQIECKMTRDDLRDRQLSDELILDIERYRSHPDRELLYCFVYDPGEFISNPTAIENDLSRTEGDRTLRVSIYPKR
jgi:hypothetical protein